MARGRPQALAQRCEQLGGDVLDVAAALVDRLDLALVRVEADHLVALARKGDGQWKSYVSESDDSDLHARDSRSAACRPSLSRA